MYHTDRFHDKEIDGSEKYGNYLEDKNSGGCFSATSKFTLNLNDELLKKDIADINYSVITANQCDSKVWTFKPSNPSIYKIAHHCTKKKGKVNPVMDIWVDYAEGSKYEGKLNIVNRPQKKLPQYLRLIGNPVPANDSGYYQPSFPATIDNNSTVIFSPIVKTPYKATTVFKYGYDSSTYCSFSFTWNVNKCLVDAKTSNEKLIDCSASASSIVDNGCTATFTATDIIILAEVTVNVTNKSTKYPLVLNEFSPEASQHYKYNPAPATNINPANNKMYTYTGPSGSTARISYGLNQNYYCDLSYSNTGGVCGFQATTHGSEPIRDLQCDAVLRPDEKCFVEHNISVVEKERILAITLNNNVVINNQSQVLTRTNLLPSASDYPYVPAEKLSPGETQFSYQQDSKNLHAGSVQYALNENQYCVFTYTWQYAKDVVSGCKITAKAINIGDPLQSIICDCNQVNGSDLCTNQRISGQNCIVDITLETTPLTQPSLYHVELENIYYYALNLTSDEASLSGNYNSAPPQSIGPSVASKFTFIASKKSDRPTVIYSLADQSGRSCSFTYYYDSIKKQCVATAQNTGGIHCNMCSAKISNDNKSCDFLLSVGGQCVMQ